MIILTQLASKGLKRKNFAFKKPKYEDTAQYGSFKIGMRQSLTNKEKRAKITKNLLTRQIWQMRTISMIRNTSVWQQLMNKNKSSILQ